MILRDFKIIIDHLCNKGHINDEVVVCTNDNPQGGETTYTHVTNIKGGLNWDTGKVLINTYDEIIKKPQMK